MTPDWKPVAELPDWDHRPTRQFVHVEGWRAHSGVTWRRQYAGDALIDKDGPQGYRREDIERLMRDGDMDDGEVTFWAPYAVTWPADPRPQQKMETTSNGPSAYDAGRWAAVAEEPRESCPHKEGSRLAKQWLAGYDHMMARAREALAAFNARHED